MALCRIEKNEEKKKERDDYSEFGGLADDYRFWCCSGFGERERGERGGRKGKDRK
jgi:hypothetical protein